MLISDLFQTDYNGLLTGVPAWVVNAINRRARLGKVVIVSAVCPDYERSDGRFNYDRMGDGLPFTAARHLEVVQAMRDRLYQNGVGLEYYVTLADTEFDLPEVVEKMSDGDVAKFLALCQNSCEMIQNRAAELDLPIRGVMRFTSCFQDWFVYYHQALAIALAEVRQNSSVRSDLCLRATERYRLYNAMASVTVDQQYCEKMVIRQWAQYMAWGECATRRFGAEIVMMNHETTNLSRVNHQAFRAGRERIPILKMNISTLP